jgi:hypothetical protein
LASRPELARYKLTLPAYRLRGLRLLADPYRVNCDSFKNWCTAAISGRWADLNHAYPDPAVAFTLPFKRYVWGLDTVTPDPKLTEHVHEALAHGYAIVCSGKAPADPAPLRHYVTFRRRLERAHVPGYPDGYRDTLGLRWNSAALSACTFRDSKMGMPARTSSP